MVSGDIVNGISPTDAPEEDLRVVIGQIVVEDVPAQQDQVRSLRVNGVQQFTLPLPVGAGVKIGDQGDADGVGDAGGLHAVAADGQAIVETREDKEQENGQEEQENHSFSFHTTISPFFMRLSSWRLLNKCTPMIIMASAAGRGEQRSGRSFRLLPGFLPCGQDS